MGARGGIRAASERFNDEVVAGIEKLAKDLNVPKSAGMGLTKAYFLAKGKVQAKVTVADFKAAVAEIKAMHQEQSETRAADADDNSRLPLTDGTDPKIIDNSGQNDDAQRDWKKGRWHKAFSIQDIRARFADKIKAGEQITSADLDTLKAEKAAEEALKKSLIDERPDPKSEPLDCLSPLHKDGAPRTFQPTTRFKIERSGDKQWRRRKHEQGDDFMTQGNFIVPQLGVDAEGNEILSSYGDNYPEELFKKPYCPSCRQAAWDLNADSPKPRKVTFYDAENADRKIGAIMKNRKSKSAAMNELGLTGHQDRHSGPRMPKAMRATWKTEQRGNRRGDR